ncbi:hypothetical protein VNO80_03150 [Phaseolus coccineus]|uniref:Uncharacterized protein n=1 Tax=Phaseolus coccineus TaxID=3886 RepID=A0AAN9RMV3_PHACN
MAKRMRAAAALPDEPLKQGKAPVIVAPNPIDQDEETTSGFVFKRRRRVELQYSQGLLQEAKQLQADKSNNKLKGELAQKDKDFAEATKAFKMDTAQSYLMGFEATIAQASGLHLEIDY